MIAYKEILKQVQDLDEMLLKFEKCEHVLDKSGVCEKCGMVNYTIKLKNMKKSK
jgi:DNA-directed RNA polymerase beta' subunit